MTTKITFGAFEPDKPPHMHDGLSDMANAYPSSLGYRPVGQFSAITPALAAAFNGGAAYVASDGSSSLIGSTATALYRYASGSWSAMATGLSSTDTWRFTQFGDVAVAVGGSATQAIDLKLGTAAALGGSPPTATSVATVRDFVVYGQAGGDRAMVQWSGFNDATSNVAGVGMAGFQPMLDGGAVMGIVGGEYGIIIQRRRVVRMTYTGDADTPFQFDPISDEIGAVAKGSIANSGRQIFFLSDKGFQTCDGNTVTPIGIERVDATFFADHPRSALAQMTSAIDPRRTVVAWFVPGNPGRMWLYNWGIDRWAKIETSGAAIFSGFTANIGLEELDALYPDGLESIPYSLDDERWAGGDPLYLVASLANEIGTLSGANMPAWFQTPFIELNDRRRTRMRAVAPIGDMTFGISLTLDARQRLGDREAKTTRSILQPSGLMPVRSNGLYIAARLDMAAGATWAYALGLEFIPAVGGGR